MVGWLDGWAGGKDGSAGLGGIIVELVEIVLLVIVRLERFRCNCTTKLAGRSSSEVPEERSRLRLLGTAYCEQLVSQLNMFSKKDFTKKDFCQ